MTGEGYNPIEIDDLANSAPLVFPKIDALEIDERARVVDAYEGRGDDEELDVYALTQQFGNDPEQIFSGLHLLGRLKAQEQLHASSPRVVGPYRFPEPFHSLMRPPAGVVPHMQDLSGIANGKTDKPKDGGN